MVGNNLIFILIKVIKSSHAVTRSILDKKFYFFKKRSQYSLKGQKLAQFIPYTLYNSILLFINDTFFQKIIFKYIIFHERQY